jgi:hypothetical protein
MERGRVRPQRKGRTIVDAAMQALLALLLISAGADPADDYRLVNPKAIELFERDGALMRWALRLYDKDHDGYLSVFEADDAGRRFKVIADSDNDGRVTPYEYRTARAFIVARWAVAD